MSHTHMQTRHHAHTHTHTANQAIQGRRVPLPLVEGDLVSLLSVLRVSWMMMLVLRLKASNQVVWCKLIHSAL